MAAGTWILTPNGNIPREELNSGGRVIGYNFEIHHVKDIRQSSYLSYYLINGRTKLKGTNDVNKYQTIGLVDLQKERLFLVFLNIKTGKIVPIL